MNEESRGFPAVVPSPTQTASQTADRQARRARKAKKKAKRKEKLRAAEAQLAQLQKVIEDLKDPVSSPSPSNSSHSRSASSSSSSSSTSSSSSSSTTAIASANTFYSATSTVSRYGVATPPANASGAKGTTRSEAMVAARAPPRSGLAGMLVSNVSFVVFVAVVMGLLELLSLVIAYQSMIAHILMLSLGYAYVGTGLAFTFFIFRLLQRRPVATQDQMGYFYSMAMTTLFLGTALCVSGFVFPLVWDVSINHRTAYDIRVEQIPQYPRAVAWTFTDSVVLTEYSQSVALDKLNVFVAPLVSREELTNAQRDDRPVRVLCWAKANQFSDFLRGAAGGISSSIGPASNKLRDQVLMGYRVHGDHIAPSPEAPQPLIIDYRDAKKKVAKYHNIFVYTNAVCWIAYIVLTIPLAIFLNNRFPNNGGSDCCA